ncbi:MAG: ABC transporter permease [Lachnospiraceae bacterium]|nr:ABC transporter permease [Lachnospiraceae bacterium]
MRLTAELALDQIRGNRKRSAGAIMATALSAALLTAVMCFASSGYRMLENFLGPGLGEYAGAYLILLVIPSVFLGLLIVFMSITVISNIYESSTVKRLGEFGVLKCVGATGRQIRETVIFESLWISIIAVPLGLIAGTVIGFIGVEIAGRYIAYFNELSKSIVMRPVSFELGFHVTPATYVFSAVFSMLVVLASAAKPAARSGKITAIECIKGIHLNLIKNVKVKENPVIEKLFGYEGTLGSANISRNRIAYRSTVRALALSIMLIMLAGSFKNQAHNAMNWMSSMGNAMLVDYASIMDEGVNEQTGKDESVIVKPISYDTAQEITEKLRAYKEDLDIIGVGSDRVTYRSIADDSIMSSEFLTHSGIMDEHGEIKTELLTADEKTYVMLCGMAGVPVGSNILINYYVYNDNGRIKELEPFTGDVKEIELIDSSNVEKKLSIDGILYKDQLPSNGFESLAPDPVRIIVPSGNMRGFTWYSDPADDASFTQYARSVMDEYYPILTEDSYVEQGYTVRISRADQMIKVMNIAIILGEIVLSGLIIMLMFMGFASVISTLSANIRIRQREFAVLKSVGMTNRALEKMVFSESAICSIKGCLGGIIWGIVLPYAINLSVRKVFPVRYELPALSLLFGVLTVLGLVILITRVEIGKMRGQNIVEDIRENLC